jgi:hypothetical protein
VTKLRVSADQRHAAARSFDGGDAVADWLASEQDVDALLSRGGD